MKIENTLRILLLHLIFTFSLSIVSTAQILECDNTSLADFYDLYGGQSAFSTHSVAAVTTFIAVEEAIQAEDYAQAQMLIDNLFGTYPKGDNVWWNVWANPTGANLGTPHGYYGLRMMEDIVDYHLNFDEEMAPDTAFMSIVLVGCSEGIQPTTETQLQNGTGPFVTNTIVPDLMENDYCLVRQTLDLFSKYVKAITVGELVVAIEFVELPDLCLPVDVSNTQPYFALGSMVPVFEGLSDEINNNTDWFWILYPSHVPEFPTFDDEAFITGGMGADAKGGPVFISDDKWLVRKPAHLGTGDMNDIERRVYLPQWLQHEFFHHLYRIYPELNLEVDGHDWFNQDFWPDDFEGQFEPDYYAETLHKRLQIDCAPLARKLITRVQDDAQQFFSDLAMEELIGAYSLDAVQNDWHVGEIIQQGNLYFWKNSANVQWQVTPNIAEGKLETGPDCPCTDQDFFLELYRTVEGDYIPGVVALKFQGEIYKKRFNILREIAPIEIALGIFQRKPTENPLHTGTIIKDTGQFFWENEAGDLWSLTPNAEEENFALNNDSPTPGEAFELIMVEDECGLYVLGFKYLEDYYWKPKRDELNATPTLINPIADQVLQENFGTYAIDVSTVFVDLEEEVLLLFASSNESVLISTSLNGQELQLSGGAIGSAIITVTAMDSNGGCVMDEFNVEVMEIVGTDDVNAVAPVISIFPNPTRDYIFIVGETAGFGVAVFSADQSFHQVFSVAGKATQIDMRHLSAGVYFVLITDLDSGDRRLERVVRY